MKVIALSVPRVSVVIPTYGRPSQLARCLESLSKQTLSIVDFEVVVVDDGSPLPCDTIVDEWATRIRVRLVRQENAGPAAARNRGAHEAVGDLLAFTDDDCVPSPTWLECLLAGQQAFPGSLVGGETVNGLSDDIFSATSQMIIDLVYEHFNADPDDAYFVTSNNMLCRRDQLLAIGGFDASFSKAGAEDRDFCDRWRSAGLRLIFRPQAMIGHFHRQTLGKFLELHYRYGRGAHLYAIRRRQRGTGTMRDDLGFHATLPRRVWRQLAGTRGLWRRTGMIALLVAWQTVNAVGFFSAALSFQACSQSKR